MTPQKQRNIRLKNDYQEMKNIQGSIVQWRILEGEPPYVESYEVTVKVKTFIGPDEFRDSHVIKVTLPEGYPMSAPEVKMISSPQPYHPNWYNGGKWCYGSWSISEGLGHHVVRMMKTLQYDKEITNPDSPANSDAKRWYLNNLERGKFPCDRQVLPDPTKSKFEVQTSAKKKFSIQV
jgi:ubiquitin-protein ligase